MEATKRWWVEERDHYRLFVSSVVDDEIRQGDPEVAGERQALVLHLPRLEVTGAVIRLASRLFEYLRLPRDARLDAFHLALACHWDMDFLLTWNLKHIASGQVRYHLARFHDATGIRIPEICTPEELLEWRTES
jgi:hypothetical protein